MPALGEKTVLPIEYGAKDNAIKPAVIGEVKPVFFEKASKVIIQLVKDNLSKAKLGDLETYADGKGLPMVQSAESMSARLSYCLMSQIADA